MRNISSLMLTKSLFLLLLIMIRKNKICPKCEKSISVSNFNRHFDVCQNTKHKIFSIPNETFYDGKWHCQECLFIGKTKQSLSSHYYLNHTATGQMHRPLNKIPPWNKGLTKEDHPSIIKYAKTQSDKCSKGEMTPYLKYYQNLQPIDKKEEKLKWKRRKQIKELDQQGNTIYLDSNYERTTLKSLNSNNIRWIRPVSSFPYIDNKGVNRSYTPDFYLVDYNVYLDPKNDLLIKRSGNLFNWVIEQNKINLIILRKNELSWRVIQNKISLLPLLGSNQGHSD